MLIQYPIPNNINYIGVFLTLRCNFGCSYCINKFGEHKPVEELSTAGWIEGLCRLKVRPDLPITLQGGEPTLHPGWMDIANALWRQDTPIDLLTNGSFNISSFTNKVFPLVFKRNAKYASIRFSFHPSMHNAHALATKVMILESMGYSVGIWGLSHPLLHAQNKLMEEICFTYGVDFRMKKFLGWYDGRFYGETKYKGACDAENKAKLGNVDCRTSELLISPSGHIYRCHSDLYAGVGNVGHILDPEIEGVGEWKGCSRFGMCNPCDIKVKTNRFQEFGHTSVEIRKGRGVR